MAAPRKRTIARAEARRVSKDVVDRQRLAALEAGGSPSRPMEVVTAALVEPKARAVPCAICGGAVRVEDHTAQTIEGAPLRLAAVYCPACGLRRTVYFAIRPPLSN